MKLNPWFVTGFTDADGSFSFTPRRDSTSSLGWRVQLKFSIGVLNNLANREFVDNLVSFFGGGRVYLDGNQLYYRVSDLKTLLRVRDHFLLYPLQSTKLIYFQLWVMVLDMMVTKEHKT